MSGKHENLPPAGYVQALPTIEHGDRIDPSIATAWIEGYPAIIRALNLIREDNGGPSWPPEARPLVAARWVPWLDVVEQAIALLSDAQPAKEDVETIARLNSEPFCYVDSELYTFCNGECSCQEAIAARAPGLTISANFLNDFFEGWSLYGDDAFDPSGEGSPRL